MIEIKEFMNAYKDDINKIHDDEIYRCLLFLKLWLEDGKTIGTPIMTKKEMADMFCPWIERLQKQRRKELGVEV